MQKTPNIFFLHLGIDTFGANLALTVQGAAESQQLPQSCALVPHFNWPCPTLQPDFFSIRIDFFFKCSSFEENMLGPRMLPKPNFPTFIGNSPAMYTINQTVPLNSPLGPAIVSHTSTARRSLLTDFFSVQIDSLLYFDCSMKTC